MIDINSWLAQLPSWADRPSWQFLGVALTLTLALLSCCASIASSRKSKREEAARKKERDEDIRRTEASDRKVVEGLNAIGRILENTSRQPGSQDTSSAAVKAAIETQISVIKSDIAREGAKLESSNGSVARKPATVPGAQVAKPPKKEMGTPLFMRVITYICSGFMILMGLTSLPFGIVFIIIGAVAIHSAASGDEFKSQYPS